MATPPKFTAFRIEDYKDAPQWLERLLLVLNDVLSSAADALDARLTRVENFQAGEKLGATFVGGSILKINQSLITSPKHVCVTRLKRVDNVAITSAWSMTWMMNPANNIELTFQGLTTSVNYACNVTYE